MTIRERLTYNRELLDAESKALATAKKNFEKIPESGMDKHHRPYIEDLMNLGEWIRNQEEKRIPELSKRAIKRRKVRTKGTHFERRKGHKYGRWVRNYRMRYVDIKGRFAKRL